MINSYLNKGYHKAIEKIQINNRTLIPQHYYKIFFLST